MMLLNIILFIGVLTILYALVVSGSVSFISSFFFMVVCIAFMSIFVFKKNFKNIIVKSCVFVSYVISGVLFYNIDINDVIVKGNNKTIFSYYIWTLGFLGTLLLMIYPNNTLNEGKIYVKIVTILTLMITIIGFIYIFIDWITTLPMYIKAIYAYNKNVNPYLNKIQIFRKTNEEHFKYVGKLIIQILIVIVFLAILYPYLEPKLENIDKFSYINLIYLIIIYIPCLFLDLVKYINKELKLANNITNLLLVIQIILVILFFAYPTLYNTLYFRNSVSLLNEPKYLDTYYEVGTTKFLESKKKSSNILRSGYSKDIEYSDETIEALNLYEKINNDYIELIKHKTDYSSSDMTADTNTDTQTYCIGSDAECGKHIQLYQEKKDSKTYYETLYMNDISGVYNTEYHIDKSLVINYTLSFWIYINPTQQNIITDEWLDVLDYGNKIKIQYGLVNNQNNIIRFTIRENDKDTFKLIHLESNIPSQKWNNFIFKYYDNKVDIFMNGILRDTISNVFINREEYNLITIGQNNGMTGSICSIIYYPYSLSIDNINQNYANLINNNPPII